MIKKKVKQSAGQIEEKVFDTNQCNNKKLLEVEKGFLSKEKRTDKYRRIFRPVHKVSTLIRNKNEIYM